MKFIPSNYELKDGKEAPAGTVICKCSKCGAKFAVPESEMKNITDKTLCQVCGDAATASQEIAVENAMAGTMNTSDEINKALGK